VSQGDGSDARSTGGCAVSCAREWLGRILAAMGIEAHLEVRRRAGRHIVDARCGAAAPLAIGPRGETLEAIQLVIARILERNCAAGLACVEIDVEGYGARHRRNLIHRALRTAEEARESGETLALDALNPYERFLVHDALRGDPRVTSTSTGEGHLRRVLIAPAGAGEVGGA